MTTTPNTLNDLLRSMRAREDLGDWTNLPTFGGEEPASTAEVWSWDADRLIVGTCADDVRIVTRAEWHGL